LVGHWSVGAADWTDFDPIFGSGFDPVAAGPDLIGFLAVNWHSALSYTNPQNQQNYIGLNLQK